MQIYNSIFKTCDQILNVLVKQTHHRLSEADIYTAIEEDLKFDFRSALHHLVEDKLIKEDFSHYLLLGAGSILQANGGYKNKFEEENEAKYLQKELIK